MKRFKRPISEVAKGMFHGGSEGPIIPNLGVNSKKPTPLKKSIDAFGGSVNEETAKLHDKPKAKSDPYADAAKKDPKLGEYVKARKGLKKGTPEWNANQNKINAAYGVKKRYDEGTPKVEEAKVDETKVDETKVDETKVEETKAEKITKNAGEKVDKITTRGDKKVERIKARKAKRAERKESRVENRAGRKESRVENKAARQEGRAAKKEARQDRRAKVKAARNA